MKLVRKQDLNINSMQGFLHAKGGRQFLRHLVTQFLCVIILVVISKFLVKVCYI